MLQAPIHMAYSELHIDSCSPVVVLTSIHPMVNPVGWSLEEFTVTGPSTNPGTTFLQYK